MGMAMIIYSRSPRARLPMSTLGPFLIHLFLYMILRSVELPMIPTTKIRQEMMVFTYLKACLISVGFLHMGGCGLRGWPGCGGGSTTEALFLEGSNASGPPWESRTNLEAAASATIKRHSSVMALILTEVSPKVCRSKKTHFRHKRVQTLGLAPELAMSESKLSCRENSSTIKTENLLHVWNEDTNFPRYMLRWRPAVIVSSPLWTKVSNVLMMHKKTFMIWRGWILFTFDSSRKPTITLMTDHRSYTFRLASRPFLFTTCANLSLSSILAYDEKNCLLCKHYNL